MEITPEQLRYLREQRKLTRDELAKELDCSAGAIVQWEGGKRAIPSWVADKMFSKLPITFTVQELAEMYDLCREEAFTMGELIQESVREKLKAHRATKTPPSPTSYYTTTSSGTTHGLNEPTPDERISQAAQKLRRDAAKGDSAGDQKAG